MYKLYDIRRIIELFAVANILLLHRHRIDIFI
jgi:hypothetical protein